MRDYLHILRKFDKFNDFSETSCFKSWWDAPRIASPIALNPNEFVRGEIALLSASHSAGVAAATVLLFGFLEKQKNISHFFINIFEKNWWDRKDPLFPQKFIIL